MSFRRPSVAWGFLAGSRLFEGSAAPAAAAAASKLFLGDFRRDVPASGNAYFGLRSSFRAMVFPRPGGPCLCGHSSSSSSSRCRPSVAWGFLAGSRLFEGSAAPAAAAAAAAPSSQHRETYSKLFLGDFRRDVPASGNAYFGLHSSFRAMVFPHPWGFLAGSRLFEGSAAPAAAAAAAASKLFLGDFRRDVPAPGNTYFGLHSSFRAMVFPRPGGPCLSGVLQ